MMIRGTSSKNNGFLPPGKLFEFNFQGTDEEGDEEVTNNNNYNISFLMISISSPRYQ